MKNILTLIAISIIAFFITGCASSNQYADDLEKQALHPYVPEKMIQTEAAKPAPVANPPAASTSSGIVNHFFKDVDTTRMKIEVTEVEYCNTRTGKGIRYTPNENGVVVGKPYNCSSGI